MDQQFRRIFTAETKDLDEESRSLVVTISTPTPDRSGDVVVPRGGRLAAFKKNPVVLFGHKYDEPPIARADDIKVSDDGIKAKVTFPAEGVYTFADAIFGLIKAGILHAWSIGFQANHDDMEELPGGGLKFNKWELLEFSAVPVPANPEALTILRSKGIDEKKIEEVVEDDEPVKVEVGITKVAFDLEEKFTIITYTVDGEEQIVTHPLSEEDVVKLIPPPDDPKPHPEDVSKALTALRDALKPADKEIGLALRSLKHLLANPK